MTNEQLVELAQIGDRDALLQLWEGVKMLVWKLANKWAVYGGNGVETDDLLQEGFIAMLRALETYDRCAGAKFSTFFVPVLKTQFTAATGQRTKRDREDPLQSAASLDAPLTADDEDFTLADTLEDPAAEDAFEDVAERDRLEHIRDILDEAIDRLEPNQREVIRKKYFRQETISGYGHVLHKTALMRLRHPAVSGRLRAHL